MSKPAISGVEPYLFFRGQCEQAIAHYRERLDAEVLSVMRFSEAPEQPPGALPEGFADRIMHSTLRINGANVMMSDGLKSGRPEFESVSLTLLMSDAESAKRYFDAMAQDGEVQMPMGPTFFSPCFGSVKDRFGLSWMFIVGADEAQA